ncbi:hypothetical protein LIER_24389 [Lithospermum erythrorhizon]|uniref:Uncharacterized protein n=1 Tax=Lithospermum erythrorhizon TaxID=34254 RepID=A0AAV3R146_LITER
MKLSMASVELNIYNMNNRKLGSSSCYMHVRQELQIRLAEPLVVFHYEKQDSCLCFSQLHIYELVSSTMHLYKH